MKHGTAQLAIHLDLLVLAISSWSDSDTAMRPIFSVCAVLLILGLFAVTQALNDIRSGGSCCPKNAFVKKKIPVNQIVSYTLARRSCPRPGYILKLKRHKFPCVDLEAPWMEHYITKKLITMKNA